MTCNIVHCDIRSFEATNECDAEEKRRKQERPPHCHRQFYTISDTYTLTHRDTQAHYKMKETLKYVWLCFVIVNFAFCIDVDMAERRFKNDDSPCTQTHTHTHRPRCMRSFHHYMPQIILMCQSLRPFKWFSGETCRNELNFAFLMRTA